MIKHDKKKEKNFEKKKSLIISSYGKYEEGKECFLKRGYMDAI